MITFTTRPTRGPSERSFGDFVQVPSRRNRGRRRPRAPAQQEPSKQEPSKQEPAKQEPAKQEPAKQEPAKQEPAKPAPAKQVPAQLAPVKKTLPLDAIAHIWYNSEIEDRLKARGIKLWSDDPDNL